MDDRQLPSDPAKQLDPESQAETQAYIDLARSVAPKSRHHLARYFWLGLITLGVLIVAGLWVLGGHNMSQPTKPTKNTKSTASASKTIPTQNYSSGDFNLNVSYPNGWKVVDSGTGPMTITSPAITLKSDTGQNVAGLITVAIQNQGQLPSGFNAGTDLAVMNSQTINFSHPTSSQASQTYLSFIQYSTTTVKGGLDAIYITGNYGYQQDQVIPASDINSISPLVTASFTRCGNSSCTTNLSPLTLSDSDWNDSSFKLPITTILSSLEFN